MLWLLGFDSVELLGWAVNTWMKQRAIGAIRPSVSVISERISGFIFPGSVFFGSCCWFLFLFFLVGCFYLPITLRNSNRNLLVPSYHLLFCVTFAVSLLWPSGSQLVCLNFWSGSKLF